MGEPWVATAAIRPCDAGGSDFRVPVNLAVVLARRRLAIWGEAPLMFEDEFPDQPLQLEL